MPAKQRNQQHLSPSALPSRRQRSNQSGTGASTGSSSSTAQRGAREGNRDLKPEDRQRQRLEAAAKLPNNRSSLQAQQHRKRSGQPGSSWQQLKPETGVQPLDLSSIVQRQSWQDKGWEQGAVPAQQLLLQDLRRPPEEDPVTAADTASGTAAPAGRGKPAAGGQLVASPKTQKKVTFHVLCCRAVC